MNLTPKDIRDIAAYWGSVCSYVTRDGSPIEQPVSHLLWDILAIEHSTVKLHLRPIESLTDEEVFNLADIALCHPVDRVNCTISRYGRSLDYNVIHFGLYTVRHDGSSYHSDRWLSADGLFGSGDGSDGNEVSTYNEAAVFAYLQSIGVYVPGTINPQLIQVDEQDQPNV